jgi:hypothetical protein
MFDTGKPKRRLSDPGVALEHERGGPGGDCVDEGVDRGKLLVPADDLEHRPHDDRDRPSDEGNCDALAKLTPPPG